MGSMTHACNHVDCHEFNEKKERQEGGRERKGGKEREQRTL